MKSEDFILQFKFLSREGTGKGIPSRAASKSEIQRWLKAGNIRVNGEVMLSREEIDFPIFSLVLWPKSKQGRCTLL